MKSAQIIGIILLLSSNLSAQEPTANFGDTYFFLGLSLSITKVRDQAHSPQLYQGWTPTLSLGYQSVGKQGVMRNHFSYIFSPMNLSPKARPKPERQLSSANVNTFQFSTALYKRVGDYSTEGWNRYVGGAITFTFDTRLYNLPSNNLFGYQCNTLAERGCFCSKKVGRQMAIQLRSLHATCFLQPAPEPYRYATFDNGRFFKRRKTLSEIG